jgi:hypothetical protein
VDRIASSRSSSESVGSEGTRGFDSLSGTEPGLGSQLRGDRRGGPAGQPGRPGGSSPRRLVAEVGGSQVEDREDFNARMRGYPARTAVSMTLFRQGTTRNISIKPVEYPNKPRGEPGLGSLGNPHSPGRWWNGDHYGSPWVIRVSSGPLSRRRDSQIKQSTYELNRRFQRVTGDRARL